MKIQGLENYTEREIKDIVIVYIYEKFKESDVEFIGILDIELYGSRIYNGALPNSDLDVVVGYIGDIREDDFFNMVHDEYNPLIIDDIYVDINPLNIQKIRNH